MYKKSVVKLPLYKYARSGQFSDTLGWLPELSWPSRKKNKVVLCCFSFLQHCSQIIHWRTIYQIYITLRTMCLDIPHSCCSVLMSNLKIKSKYLKLSRVDDVIARLSRSLFLLVNLSLFLVESIVVGVFIYWWNEDLALLFLFCAIIFAFLAHFTL